MINSKIHKIPDHARVFLRADANIPLSGESIFNDFRLRALKPTLDVLTQKNATIMFATHIGRPKKYDPSLSTQLLLPWFSEHGYAAQFAATLKEALSLSIQNKPNITVIENLRFFEGEQNNDLIFAEELAQLADFYVDDAFAALHRKDTSIYILPSLFPPKKRMIGLLIENEIKHLNVLLKKPRTGYTLILGGGKISTKIPLLKKLMHKVDTIILLPAIVFTFLKVQGKDVGNSLVDDAELETCKEVIKQAQNTNTYIPYPLDYQVAQENTNGALSYTTDDSIPKNSVGISIGPRSIAAYTEIILKSDTIFYNGLMGMGEKKETLESVQKLFAAIAASSSYSVVAGGDSVALIEKLDLADQISYLSTGGGATLAFLSGESLPGLAALTISE